MNTYIHARDLACNPLFPAQRRDALNLLRNVSIDKPIIDVISGFAELPYCFTLQSCYGHFLFDDQLDPHGIEPLPTVDHEIDVEYRIAYIAICVQTDEPGRLLLRELSELPLADPRNIHHGCAEWFWKRQINSYVLQVEPERYKTRDRCVVGYKEALHIEKTRNRFFDMLRQLLKNRV